MYFIYLSTLVSLQSAKHVELRYPHIRVSIPITRPHASPFQSHSPALSQRLIHHNPNHSQKHSTPNPTPLILPFHPIPNPPFSHHPSIPPGGENVKDIDNHGNIPIMAALSKLHDPIIQWFNSHLTPCRHPLRFLPLMDAPPRHPPPNPSNCFLLLWSFCEFDDLPRTPSFSWDQLPSLFRRSKDLECRDKTEADFIKTSMEANALSWASVFNSFWALEDQFLEFLGSRKGHSKVYSVGPVNMVNGPAQLRVGDTKADSNNGVISWLDGCDDGSISYVCFGSQKLLTTAQVEALATRL
ncbi:hypothetical protein OROMI_013619 [Orobanche minor]